MSGKDKKNIAASVLAKLRSQSKSGGMPFQQILQHYAMEQFLFRISNNTGPGGTGKFVKISVSRSSRRAGEGRLETLGDHCVALHNE
jgi:hypothetical protein